jgi:hypothetical protein
MTDDELLHSAYEAIKDLRYQAEYRADPNADKWADVIMNLVNWRDNAINAYPDLDRRF